MVLVTLVLQVKRGLAQVVIAMASQDYLSLEGGQSLVEFIIRHSAITDAEIDKFVAAKVSSRDDDSSDDGRCVMVVFCRRCGSYLTISFFVEKRQRGGGVRAWGAAQHVRQHTQPSHNNHWHNAKGNVFTIKNTIPLPSHHHHHIHTITITFTPSHQHSIIPAHYSRAQYHHHINTNMAITTPLNHPSHTAHCAGVVALFI